MGSSGAHRTELIPAALCQVQTVRSGHCTESISNPSRSPSHSTNSSWTSRRACSEPSGRAVNGSDTSWGCNFRGDRQEAGPMSKCKLCQRKRCSGNSETDKKEHGLPAKATLELGAEKDGRDPRQDRTAAPFTDRRTGSESISQETECLGWKVGAQLWAPGPQPWVALMISTCVLVCSCSGPLCSRTWPH